jgi:hypothetical protein
MKIKKKNGEKIKFSQLSLLLLIFVGLFSFNPLAQAKSKNTARVTIDPKEVAVGDRFVVNIEISGEEMSSVNEPKVPEIKNAQFQQRSTSQRLNSMTVTNASGSLEYKAVQTVIYSFIYQATAPGQVMVPSMAVDVGGDMARTAPASLKIVAQGSSPRGRQPSRPNDDIDDVFGADPLDDAARMEDRFMQLLQRRFGNAAAGGFQAIPQINERDSFVIVAEVDKTNVFKGEQITASWYLYTKAGVREIDTLKYPNLKGFWKEDIELATILNFQPAQLNGQQYNKALLASYALFPIEEGKAVVDAYRAKVTVVGGFGESMTLTKNSETIPILVKPLPKQTGTAMFSGAVGEFQIKADLDSRTMVTHQPFSLKVHVEGRGNAKQFELPALDLPPDVEVYDIKKDAKFFKTGTSFKEFEILLIPRKEGDLIIPPIKTTIFNPRTEKYEELSTPELKVHVLPGSGAQGIQASRLGDGQGKKSDEANEALHLLTQWTPQNKQVSTHIEAWGGVFAASFFALFAFASRKLGWFKKSLAFKDYFSQRLKKIHKNIDQEKWRDVGIEAINLSYFVLGDISGQGGANLEVEKLLEKSSPSVRREIGEDLRKVMEKFYLLGFGPDLAVQATIKEGALRDDVKRLEKLLRKAIELTHADIPS